MAYDPKLKEEEVKNRVAADVFGDYDCARVIGAVDFCVSPKTSGPQLIEPESLLWAEAKSGVRADFAPLFAQLVLTLGKARTFDDHLPPPFLAAFDSEKIAFLPYHEVVDLFYLNDFNWNVAPSDETTREFHAILDRVRPLLDSRLFTFRFDEDAIELDTFIRRSLRAGTDGASASLNVTRNNFVFVYQKWARDVKPSIAVSWEGAKRQGILDADFFLADLLSKDGATLVEKLYVVLRGNHYELDRKLDAAGFIDAKRAEFNDGQKAHQLFWNRYRRPPKREYWHYIAERRDLLVPQDVRERKGSFFTPQIWVEKAQEALASALGEKWQDEYDIWDCAAGTGNLLAGLQNKYKVWASTLDQADVEVMRERIKNGANLLESHVFQFDFLNGTFDDLPEGLRAIIADPERRKKLVVFINPPYAEAGDTKQWTGTGKNKTDVAVTTATYAKYLPQIGLAGRELFAQFLIRIDKEIPGCVIAHFSKPKHLQAPNFEVFRQSFQPKLKSAFLVRGNTFDNVKGKFPIGFFIWDTSWRETFSEIDATVLANDGSVEGMKHILCYDNMRGNIGKWLSSFADNGNEPIGFMSNGRNDFQNQKLVYIINRKEQMPTPRGWHITRCNVIPMCIFLAVRHCIEADWLNDRDQFLWPADTWKDDSEFQLDCLVFTLFHGQNRISCMAVGNGNHTDLLTPTALAKSEPRSGEQIRVLTNHWIPFTEEEVRAKDCFKSHFMADFLKKYLLSPISYPLSPISESLFAEPEPSTFNLELSTGALRVMDAGRTLWRYYHAQPNALPDASFYDIRARFQGFKPNGHMNPDSSDAEYTRLIGDLRAAMKSLAAQIAPKVYAHGFLK